MIPTFGGIIKKANASAVQQEAAALYKEAYGIDLADGTLDGQEYDDPIDEVDGKEVTYSASASAVFFSYRNADKGFVASFDGTSWTTVEG